MATRIVGEIGRLNEAPGRSAVSMRVDDGGTAGFRALRARGRAGLVRQPRMLPVDPLRPAAMWRSRRSGLAGRRMFVARPTGWRGRGEGAAAAGPWRGVCAAVGSEPGHAGIGSIRHACGFTRMATERESESPESVNVLTHLQHFSLTPSRNTLKINQQNFSSVLYGTTFCCAACAGWSERPRHAR